MGTMGDVMAGQGYLSYILTLFISTLQLLILPTVLFGACFPLAVRLFVIKKRELGKETGSLYAANTLGTILGAFCAGFLLLPLMGAQMGLLVTASMNLMVGGYLVFKARGVKLIQWMTVGSALLLFRGLFPAYS